MIVDVKLAAAEFSARTYTLVEQLYDMNKLLVGDEGSLDAGLAEEPRAWRARTSLGSTRAPSSICILSPLCVLFIGPGLEQLQLGTRAARTSRSRRLSGCALSVGALS